MQDFLSSLTTQAIRQILEDSDFVVFVNALPEGCELSAESHKGYRLNLKSGNIYRLTESGVYEVRATNPDNLPPLSVEAMEAELGAL